MYLQNSFIKIKPHVLYCVLLSSALKPLKIDFYINLPRRNMLNRLRYTCNFSKKDNVWWNSPRSDVVEVASYEDGTDKSGNLLSYTQWTQTLNKLRKWVPAIPSLLRTEETRNVNVSTQNGISVERPREAEGKTGGATWSKRVSNSLRGT